MSILKKSSTYWFLLVVFFFMYFSSCTKSSDIKSSVDEELVLESEEEAEEKEEELPEDKPIINDAATVDESDFFTAPTTHAVVKNLVTDYGADMVFNTDDSAILQTAIDDVNLLGGGRLLIPEGNYAIAEINLRSNVHLEIDAKAVIRPSERENQNNYSLFIVTNNTNSEPIENVSISGINGSFTVDLRNTVFKNLRIIQSFNAKNFKYSNMLVEDDYSKFSAIEFNGVKIGSLVYGPTYGVVKNIRVNNADYGYGVVQLQLGSNIYFNNLEGIGGITLRIETHNHVLQEIGSYTPPNTIFGRNIRSEKGNCALMLSPHFINNGIVDVRDITAIGSGFAVRVENGFTTTNEAALGLTAGSFDSKSILRNITATYVSNNAQLKPKHYRYMPCSLRPLIETTPIPPNNVSYFGPSIAGLVNAKNYQIDVSENNVIGIGFIDGWNFVDDSDAIAIGNCN